MRLTAVIIIAATLHVSASTYSQKVSLNVKELSLERVFHKISEQTKFSFLWDEKLLKETPAVSVNVKDASLEDVLKKCLSGLSLTYTISPADKLVYIKKNPEPPAGETIISAGKITGMVRDEKGEPVNNANVKIKGTSKVTVTDAQGRFSILANTGDNIEISFIGYETKTITVVAGTTDYTVSLKVSVAALDDMVVVGYGTIRKKDATGSVASVNMQDMQKAPVTNFTDALAGRVAGVQVSTNDGQPGTVANIVIRGANSLTQSIAPLYVVDGFPLEDAAANSINPDDIESMNVLKDASATAIYGARGANGVIVITTKKGKAGPPVVSFNTYYGMQGDAKRLSMMNTYEYVKFQLQNNPSQNTPIYINAQHPTLESYRNSPTLDLQNQLFQTGVLQNYDIAVRGGNENTRYAVSGNIIDQKGIIITSGFKRYQGRFVLDQKINNKFKVGINVNYGYSKTSGAPIAQAGVATGLTTTNASGGFLYNIWSWRPTTGNDSLGADQLFDPTFPNSPGINPITDLTNQIRQTLNFNLFANAYLEYTFSKNLVLRVTGGITKNNAETDAFYNSNTYYGRDTIPGRTAIGNGISGSISYANNNIWLNENTLTYNKTINKDHHLNVLAGASFQKSTTENRGFATTHIPKDYETMGLNSLNLAPSLWSPTGSSYSVTASNTSLWTQASFLGRVNYDYKSRYLFTASFRADGSSKFAPGKKWGYFSSYSAAWRLSSESFMKNIRVISDAKIRAGYGETGNNRVGDFAYLPQLAFASSTSFTGYTYNNQSGSSGATVSSIGNADLKWETTGMSNIGLDLGLFKNRILFTFDWYKKVTKDLLLQANMPLTTGVSSATQNVGKMQNTGLEFSLTTTNIQTKNFKWVSSFNISFNRNKLLAVTQGANFLTIPANTIIGLGVNNTYNALSPYISVVGQPVGQMYGVIADGLYQYSDFNQLPNGSYVLKPGIPYYGSASTPQPGWAKYKDINHDGVIDTKDYTIIGRGLPIHTGGFGNNFSYKNFDLNIFFQWSYGNNLINANRIVFEAPADNFPNFINLMATEANRWSPTNQGSKIPVGMATSYAGYNSNVVEDGSYLRLKTVSLGYTLSAAALRRAKISSLRFYMSAQNLYTWTNYSGPDPDVSTRNTVQSPGFDYMAYPMPKTIVFGLNATF
ncbi:TonB-dependent receptor [Chitinophagaceae bacterium LWZ2-11]